MLATPWREPFSDPGWRFEPKWDGYRAIISYDGGSVVIRSRGGNDVTARYPELAGFELAEPAVLDAEIVVLDEGVPSFERLQQRNRRSDAAMEAHPVSCVVFDLLHLGERALSSEPIETRQALLGTLALAAPFAITDPIIGSGLELWGAVVERDLEGMVAKRSGSMYRPGVRSEDWRKIHHLHRARAVVGGFTQGEGGRAGTFGSLLVGMWQGDRLRFVGAVGTGFSDADLMRIRAALDQQIRPDSPFVDDQGLPDATWVEPSLVAVVGFRNWTDAGRFRHPRFEGFAGDPPAAIGWEAEGPF